MAEGPLLDFTAVDRVVFALNQDAATFVEAVYVVGADAVHAAVAVGEGASDGQLRADDRVVVAGNREDGGPPQPLGQGRPVLVVGAEVRHLFETAGVDVLELTALERVVVAGDRDVASARAADWRLT